MADTVFVTGSKGGAGATTLAINLCKSLARAGERTLLIDGDGGCASAMDMLGLKELCVYTLSDAQKGACRIKQAILQHPDSPNLYALSTLGCSDFSIAESAVKSCAGLFDKIVCDGVAMSACDSAVLVSEPYRHCLGAAAKRAAFLKDCGFKEAKLVLNKVNGGLVYGGEILSPQEISTLVRLPLCGVIPEDLSLPLGRCKHGTKRAFGLTAEYLFSGGGKIYSATGAYHGIAGALKKKLRELV